MSSWDYVRIDRNDSGIVHCVFCNRPLKAGSLIVLSSDQGVLAYAGRSCAKKHVGRPVNALLDLSRIALLVVIKEQSLSALERGSDDASLPKPACSAKKPLQSDDVAEYLTLRLEHMKGFAGHGTAKLREIFATLQTGLSAEDRSYVERVMANAAQNHTIYSRTNVERCIALAYWLRVCIEKVKPDRREFLQQMLLRLEKHWKLGPQQIKAINNWGEGIRKADPDFPTLNPGAFDGVEAPNFSQKRGS